MTPGEEFMPLDAPPPGYPARLPRQPEARVLEVVETRAEGRVLQLAPDAAAAWRAMRDAAAGAGCTLLLVSAFRSVERQHAIVARKLAAGVPWAEILAVNALPGHSEHHTGRAVDVGTPGCPALTEAFARTPAFAWLDAEAGRFGFRLSYPRGNAAGLAFEPWHWCWHEAGAD